VPECHDIHGEDVVEDVVDNTVIPYTYTVALPAFEFFIPMRAGIAP
jgi:hypothetical protein